MPLTGRSTMAPVPHLAQKPPRLRESEYRQPKPLAWMGLAFTRVLLLPLLHASLALAAFATCTAPKNAIEAENCLPGTPASQWYVDGSGSPNIQGFTTDISVNVGQTIFFKISTPAASYRIDIYRMGYYQGNNGRFITSISPSASLPQIQPSCLSDSATGLIDCGNWGISASWTVPSTATSGIYYAKLLRLDTGEESPIIFVVRNDSSHSDILVQTSDPTWQAYNAYGGNSFYSGNPVGRAYKVSYNRPVNATQSIHGDFFAFEYPIVHWLEANGYDVTYFTGVDTDRNGALITQHKVFMSVGHDEYWSGGQRANVEAARAVGVNLAFFSGNEVFWKTRWEASTDGTNTPYRTLVCYKETSTNGSYGGVIDPADPPTWTGFWRDARFSPPADGGRPENALTGTMSQVSAPQNNAITVPQADGRMRFWRNTSIAALGAGQVATLPQSTLGYESDEDVDNGFRPAGLIRLSTTTVAVSNYLYFSATSGYYVTNGTETHHLTLYRAQSGALVFGAGTIHWSWGVDSDHAGYTGLPADPNMQQANVNLLADMGVQPATLQMGLVLATPSTDTSPPRSVITSPVAGGTITVGSQVTVSGTAQDFGGGVVGGVEISVDGGTTWHPAVGRENWSYVFTAANSGTLNVLSRAVDDSGNLELVSPGTETVFVSPSSVSLSANQQKQFTATVTATSNQTVNWSISAVNPPSAPAGNLSSSGLYTAPATITPAQVTIKATSADGTASGTATVNLSNGAVANFTGTDTSTQGSWHGVYGADGYSVANDTQSLPSYASFAVQNQQNYTWTSSTTDPRALQTGSGTGRIASTWYNGSTFTFDVNFTDGTTHRFALYALDWDSTARAESIQIVDANSGAVLDTRNISLFNNGIYLIWNLSGHVKIYVTRTAGSNAVISGAFFGGSTSSETVTVTPASVTLSANQQKQFTATVTGVSNQTVSWTISAVNPPSAPAGNISTSGLYTAPATITPAQVTIKATSADGTASGTATVNLSNGAAVANFTGTDTSTQGN